MHLTFRNINDAFYGLVSKIHNGEIPTVVRPSRYGEVMMIEEPVIVTYDQPKERVLFSQARDCNPFFHLFESLWMLAGRNDVASLVKYNSKMSDFSDDGKTFNGAYGYRWRKANVIKPPTIQDDQGSMYPDYVGITGNQYYIDQLKILIDHLKNKPESRRAVLQMWNVEDDLLKIDESKDVCCNTHVYFSVELGTCSMCDGLAGDRAGLCRKCRGEPHDVPRYLNMTVCNRSNDLIWGMLGANAVHFSFLQEYVAANLGLDVGSYNQMTNNLHCYTKTWEPEKWLGGYNNRTMHSPDMLTYDKDVKRTIPLIENPEQFDKEVVRFIDDWDKPWEEPFLNQAATLCGAFELHKERKYQRSFEFLSATYDYDVDIKNEANLIMGDDWGLAAINWLQKRQLNWEEKNG